MDEQALRAAIEAAGQEVWTPAHLGTRLPARVGVTDIVALPVGWLAIGRADGDVFVAPVVADGGWVRRAGAGDGVVASLLDVVGGDGAPALVATSYAPVPDGRSERAIDVDQSNESIVVGERAVVKLFPRAAAGGRSPQDLVAHLAAVGFAETPTPLGDLRLRDGTVIATACAYVPGARDGWDWFVDLVTAACRDGGWESADRAAVEIGGLVARLHRAAATPSPVLERPTGVAGSDRIEAWHAQAVATLDGAVAEAPRDDGLHALAPRARAVLDRLLAVDRTPVQRIHGDLHVGQILRDVDGELWVSDFDGNPLAADLARTSLDAPARDVVAMACAIDHVGRVVIRRHPEAQTSIEDWIERGRDAFLGAYRHELGPAVSLFDVRLVHPFAVAQEAHEFRYASAFLPRWRYVPEAAMPVAISRAEAGA